MIRLHGELTKIKYRELTRDELEELLKEIITKEQYEDFNKGRDIDFSYDSEGGRYRANLYRKISGPGAVFRVIEPKIPSLQELGLPPAVQEMLNATQGMILVTGATGTGKTTTLAAMIDLLNTTQRLNIITLEDPIEHIHKSKRSLVIQREIGTHVKSYKVSIIKLS